MPSSARKKGKKEESFTNHILDYLAEKNHSLAGPRPDSDALGSATSAVASVEDEESKWFFGSDSNQNLTQQWDVPWSTIWDVPSPSTLNVSSRANAPWRGIPSYFNGMTSGMVLCMI
ncbi:hypothetical protein N7452_006152 [Penicillium brevicompactum]|uniref:Uncharacterized protein n=1 Tax=Penicillium brevicompactum TaxID=5074 RepID=A0A9W9UGD6_PENBR|nr:hypothetical protein N7452_006152 [Penicillium brevicompactum]